MKGALGISMRWLIAMMLAVLLAVNAGSPMVSAQEYDDRDSKPTLEEGETEVDADDIREGEPIESAEKEAELTIPEKPSSLDSISMRMFTEPTVDEPLPPDTPLVGKVLEVTASVRVGSFQVKEEVTFFDKPVSITFNLDRDEVSQIPSEELVVAFWDSASKTWVPLPTTVDSATGKVIGFTNHFTTFAVLRVGSVTHQLVTGAGNSVVFTGPSGTSAKAIAEAIGPATGAIWRFNAALQKWQFYAPDFPKESTLQTLNSRDVLAVILKRGAAAVEWRVPNIIPAPSGERATAVYPGWNHVAYVGPDGYTLADLLERHREITNLVVFDQQRRAWVRGISEVGADLPDVTAESVNRLDVLAIYSGAQKPFELLLPESR